MTSTVLSPADLARLALELAEATPIERVGTGCARRWVLIEETATHQAWMIAWPAGTGLELHDHDGSTAGVHVVAGELDEEYLDAAGRISTRTWRRGDVLALPADHVHAVRNRCGGEAVSVHVYSPRLGAVNLR